MTGAALESTLLNASFAPRDSSQSHPVFAGCVCRWDTSVVQQWNVSYAYPTFAPTERKGRTEICSSELLLDVVGEALLLKVVERASALPSRARAVFKSDFEPCRPVRRTPEHSNPATVGRSTLTNEDIVSAYRTALQSQAPRRHPLSRLYMPPSRKRGI